jgi:hypothetical protein
MSAVWNVVKPGVRLVFSGACKPSLTFLTIRLTAWQNSLGRIQAETNFALAEAIRERAETNAIYFDRLCARRERELADPDDVLLEAEYRKQELADKDKQEETAT